MNHTIDAAREWNAARRDPARRGLFLAEGHLIAAVDAYEAAPTGEPSPGVLRARSEWHQP